VLNDDEQLRVVRLEHEARKAKENITALWLFVILLGLTVCAVVFLPR
jgi:hypothetical protein